jgi:hypothetical protein
MPRVDLVLVHREVPALRTTGGDFAAALVGGREVEGHRSGGGDPVRCGLVVWLRSRRSAPDVRDFRRHVAGLRAEMFASVGTSYGHVPPLVAVTVRMRPLAGDKCPGPHRGVVPELTNIEIGEMVVTVISGPAGAVLAGPSGLSTAVARWCCVRLA